MGNMDLWEAVEKTDPTHTKKVNQRGGFTAIGANYQIKTATEQFGPVGIGWGYDCGEPIFSGPFIIIPLTFWHGNRDQKFGPIFGCAEIAGKRPDHDAPKKAMTDALTKALSQLGFNADVFLGQFNDNKYVEQRRREEASKKTEAATDAEIDEAIAQIKECDDLAALKNVFGAIWTNARHVADHEDVIGAKDTRKSELQQVKPIIADEIPY